jgi:Fe2+ or Zn2+ uptake regulation protein
LEAVLPRVREDSVNEKLARLVSELRRRGYRVTAQRLTIARIVFENIKSHPSFMEIVEAVRKNMPSISPSTVYNNLQLLERMGFIRSFDVAGETRYDEAFPHVNIVCLDTHDIIDVEAGELLKGLLDKVGLKASDVTSVVIYAHCGSKAEDKASGPG